MIDPKHSLNLEADAKAWRPGLLETGSGPMVIVHILVDCRDAMGANAVNTMAETASRIEELSTGTVILRIISNLAVHRLAKVSAVFTPEEMSDNGLDREGGLNVIDGVVQAYHFSGKRSIQGNNTQ